MSGRSVEANGRIYRWPEAPVVVICCDGSEPEYIERALDEGLMPNLERMLGSGTLSRALAVIPSFTNPNNLSIVTGTPPAVHGISGNYFLDPVTGREVMMNDPEFLRAPTLLAAFQEAGARIAVVTAKDKLRRLLGHGLSFDGSAVCFSAETADRATLGEHGIEDARDLVGMAVPEVYSAELSEFVFAAGVALLRSFKPDIVYLSTSDYVQHKCPPGSDGANAFYTMMDRYLGALHDARAVVAITADHGMTSKTDASGRPDVLYLQELIDGWLGAGAGQVILPITDPYVVHHGALGSFATVYLKDGSERKELSRRLADLPGVQAVHDRESGCKAFELPPDRVGDLIVLAQGSKVLGTREADHDLTALEVPLRSHGGISEQEVPLIVNRRTADLPSPLRNFDVFQVALNHVIQPSSAEA